MSSNLDLHKMIEMKWTFGSVQQILTTYDSPENVGWISPKPVKIANSRTCCPTESKNSSVNSEFNIGVCMITCFGVNCDESVGFLSNSVQQQHRHTTLKTNNPI